LIGGGCREELRMLIELRFQNRFDALALRRADRERPFAGGFQARFAIVLGEIERPKQAR
jgi:hypothetical protein